MWSLALSFINMNENVSGRTVMIQTIKYGVSFLCGDYGVAHVHFFGTRPSLTKEANPLFVQSWARLEAPSNANNVSLKV